MIIGRISGRISGIRPAGYPAGYPVPVTGYPAGYRIAKKAGYPAGRISGATLFFFQVESMSPSTDNGGGAADSWEDKADLSSAATTPEDEDVSMEDDSGE